MDSQNPKYHQNRKCARGHVLPPRRRKLNSIKTHGTGNTTETGNSQAPARWVQQVEGEAVFKLLFYSNLSACIAPAIGGVQHRQHRTALRALADLTGPSEQLRLATAQPVHRNEDELAVERIGDGGPFERHRV